MEDQAQKLVDATARAFAGSQVRSALASRPLLGAPMAPMVPPVAPMRAFGAFPTPGAVGFFTFIYIIRVAINLVISDAVCSSSRRRSCWSSTHDATKSVPRRLLNFPKLVSPLILLCLFCQCNCDILNKFFSTYNGFSFM